MLYRDHNDETLVLLTLAGEQRAYEALVVRYEKAVLNAARSVTNSSFMAEDAAQDAFVSAWMKLNMLREPDKFGAWVCRIAKNCAKNMITRYHSYLTLDALESCIAENENEENPQILYAESEEQEMVRESVSHLPEKIKEIIRLHYFEGLTIADIAEKLSIAEGTVKLQLNNGRKKLRKELCAMNEEMNDTLVRRVIKKVDELKLWQFKNSKQGFETVYKDVLREVEELPESTDKYHALADVLMRGWWWLPGEKNDALFARIREAAELGMNDDVMRFIAIREDHKVPHGHAMIDFIREKQIPRLEKCGFVKALGSEWFWLGHAYFENKKAEEGTAAYQKALEILPKSDIYHAYAEAALYTDRKYANEYASSEKNENYYRIHAAAEEYHILDGIPCRYNDAWFGRGTLCSADLDIDRIFRNASYCDGYFTDPILRVGDSRIASDETMLTFEAEGLCVDTPAGKFESCELWSVKYKESTFKTYYCSGIGIVKQERFYDGICETRYLRSYTVLGGSGIIPFHEGNRWEYTANYDPEIMLQDTEISVHYADDEKILLSQTRLLERIKYDENSWLDMIQQIRNDYWDGSKCRDIYHIIERAEQLAKTPMQKAHTKAAASVARRILDTNAAFNPKYTETGHWNFFSRNNAGVRNGRTHYDGCFRWAFELKNIDSTACQGLLYNDIYGILETAVNCISNPAWEIGKKLTESFIWNGYPIKTDIVCEDAGEITTEAGTFKNCMKLSLDISGMSEYTKYREGKKEYYFAKGIGIVRTVNHYCDGALTAIYELTSYTGEGEGYMPIEDGMIRRYDAVNLTDGHTGSAEYTYVKDDDGNIVIFSDRAGTRKKPQRITQYDCIYGEVVEEELWQQKKRPESRLRHDVNNFHLLCHFLGRPSRYWAAPKKAAAWNKYRLQIMESLGDGERVPDAWLGLYASTLFRTASALFGVGENEEAYEYLERAFEVYPEWEKFKEGDLLDVGDELIYGGVKLIKNKRLILLPDGTKEPLTHEWMFEEDIEILHYGLTAKKGWEWFNKVRDEDRFKEYIERARKLLER